MAHYHHLLIDIIIRSLDMFQYIVQLFIKIHLIRSGSPIKPYCKHVYSLNISRLLELFHHSIIYFLIFLWFLSLFCLIDHQLTPNIKIHIFKAQLLIIIEQIVFLQILEIKKIVNIDSLNSLEQWIFFENSFRVAIFFKFKFFIKLVVHKYS